MLLEKSGKATLFDYSFVFSVIYILKKEMKMGLSIPRLTMKKWKCGYGVKILKQKVKIYTIIFEKLNIQFMCVQDKNLEIGEQFI